MKHEKGLHWHAPVGYNRVLVGTVLRDGDIFLTRRFDGSVKIVPVVASVGMRVESGQYFYRKKTLV